MEEEKKEQDNLDVGLTSSLINDIITAMRYSENESTMFDVVRVPTEFEKFEDLDFPPTFSSLIRDPSKTKLDDRDKR